MFRPIENKPWTEKVLNILQLLDGIFDLLKKISWRILSFLKVILFLYKRQETQMTEERTEIRNADGERGNWKWR